MKGKTAKLLRAIINEEIARVNEIYGFGQLRDRDQDLSRRARYSPIMRYGEYQAQPEMQFTRDPFTVKKVKSNLPQLKHALMGVANAYKGFQPAWYGTLCDSPQTAELAELTLDVIEVVAPLAKTLQLGLTFESVLRAVPAEILVERGLFGIFRAQTPARERERGVLMRKITPNVTEKIQRQALAAQKAIEVWLEAYYAVPKMRRWACMGRSGAKFASALQTLDAALLAL